MSGAALVGCKYKRRDDALRGDSKVNDRLRVLFVRGYPHFNKYHDVMGSPYSRSIDDIWGSRYPSKIVVCIPGITRLCSLYWQGEES